MTPMTMIDLRSDTVTRPTPAMRQAMAEAVVGDDVADFDPTTRRLEQTVASLLGKEAALFVPSGTMSNQIALRLHGGLGDEFLCDRECHIVRYEQGAYAQLSGLVAHTLIGQRGVLTVDQLDDAVPPDDDHCTRATLLCLENTHNRGGGKIFPQDQVRAVCDWAHSRGLATHLDGARLWNAHVASGIDLPTLAAPFDTVNVCFSKGLGAPVGSALAGSAEAVAQARRVRKAFGGGMRQSGILAAGALHAVTHHLGDLADDHRRAKAFAARMADLDGLVCDVSDVETNLVIFGLDPDRGTATAWADAFTQAGVAMYPFSRQSLRAVMHRDLTDSLVEQAADRIAETLRRSVIDRPPVNRPPRDAARRNA